MKTIRITGVTGFIGLHLAKRLLGEEHKIIGFDNLNDYFTPLRRNAECRMTKKK